MPNVQFQVKLENVELSAKQIAQIQKEINGAVANTLAKQGAAKQVWGSKLKLNPEWYGKWLRQFKSLEALKLNENFKQEKIGL
ncbi:MAG TPA: hypothetical protein VK645_10745 [Chitinophagaceae bacterium]|nr:hypothetical protein [Chitinophagaceae bacterium]